MTREQAAALAQHMSVAAKLDPAIITRSTLPLWSLWRGLVKPHNEEGVKHVR